MVTDKSGVSLVQCVKVLSSSRKGIARLGSVIIVSVKRLNTARYAKLKERQKKKFSKGTLHRALIIRSKVYFMRFPGIFVRFNENSVVLVNKKIVPISNRVYGPVLKELCVKHPALGSISRFVF